MSMYQYAVMQGASALAEAITGHSGASEAAYQAQYKSTAAKLSNRQARHAIALNISSIEQDKVLTNTAINVQRAQQRAAAVVAAAAAGSEGESVDAVLYEADKAAAFAKGNEVARANQEKESLFSQLSNMGESQFSIPAPRFDIGESIVGLIGSISETDLTRWGLSSEAGDSTGGSK